MDFLKDLKKKVEGKASEYGVADLIANESKRQVLKEERRLVDSRAQQSSMVNAVEDAQPKAVVEVPQAVTNPSKANSAVGAKSIALVGGLVATALVAVLVLK